MKLMKTIFLLVLFILPFTVSAQITLTSGEIRVYSPSYFLPSNVPVSPTETVKYFGLASTSKGFQTSSNNDRRIEPLLSFFSNRSVSGAKYNITFSPEARGSIIYGNSSCQNFALSHPNQPLSTQFEISFADFQTPKFKKASSEITEIIVPITMTGRVSCVVSEDGQLAGSRLVNGTGNARLRFKSGVIRNRVHVVDALYRFGISAP